MDMLQHEVLDNVRDLMPYLSSQADEAERLGRLPDETAKRIKSLISRGKLYTLAVYPGAEHGMTEYEIGANGERVSTRFAPGYFQMMVDFIRDGGIKHAYGNAEIARAARSGR